MKTLRMIYDKMLKEEFSGPAPASQFGSMGAQSSDAGDGGGAFGKYPTDTGQPQGGEQPGYGGEATDDARLPTGMYAIGPDGKKKKFTERSALDDFLKNNTDWKLSSE